MSKKILIPAVVVIVVVGLVVAGFATGYLYAGYKTPNQRVIAQYQTCSSSLVDSYNSAMLEVDETPAKAKAIVDEAAKLSGFKNDPSCVYMQLYYYMQTGDKVNARTYYNALKDLSDKGLYPSNQFDDLQGLSTLESTVKSLEGTNPDTTGAPGVG